MKKSTKMSRTVAAIEGMYNSLNQDIWGGELPPVIVTCQSSPGSYGHCTRSKVWKRKEDDLYELNISCEHLTDLLELLDSVIHEQVHLYCRIHGINEVSRNGSYHNKTFMKLATAAHLNCIYTGATHGWTTTGADNEWLLDYAIQKGYTEIEMYRKTAISAGRRGGTQNGGGRLSPEERRPSSTRKVICPKCGQSVRATRKVNIICGDCLTPMIEAE